MQFRFALSLAMCLFARSALANAELASMELEQLMEMNVTIVSKREQTFNSAAAAIYTITQEDIRRSAATSLPEVLRMAPGMEVARINPSMWAITARGFNSQFANKLLVLIDGRSVYTPLFSGVYWDAQIPPLDDIQRVEIIRGPGASLWGSNAVNGVINIITYDSEQTTGTRIAAGAGNEERGFLRARQGFKVGNVTGRVNAQRRSVDEAVQRVNGQPSNDDYVATQAGVRLDWRPSTNEKITLDAGATETDRHADIYVPEDLAPLVTARKDLGAHTRYVVLNWLHELNNGDGLFMQVYGDYDHRFDPLNSAERFTTDYEMQYNHAVTGNHRFTWGLTHRDTRDDLIGTFIVYAEKPRQEYQLNTAFIQDEYRLSDTVNVSFGTKLEDNKDDPIEYQPSLRVAWQPWESSTLWASASRAVRTPSRLETSLEYRTEAISGVLQFLNRDYPGLRGYSVILGDEDFRSERVDAFEAGWRWHPNNALLLDVSTFRNEYERLLTYTVLPRPLNPDLRYLEEGYVGVAGLTVNQSRGESNGLEVALDYLVSERWKLKSTYSYFNFDSSHNPRNITTPAQGFERQSPEHQARITSYHTLTEQWEFDWTLRRVGELFEGYIPAYTELDIRLGRKLTPNLSVSLAGKNLLDPAKPEFVDNNYGPTLTEMQRSAFIQLDWLN